ncbi:MAG: DegV family protein [Clostridiaceae bacterium]|nr:DegV family protein [Clostridiaceae bacterium]
MIVTDSTSDLNYDLVKKYDIEVLPLEFMLGDEWHKHYADCRECSLETFYDEMKKGAITKTSQINQYTITENLSKILDKGLDVLYIAFSSGLSGTYQNSVRAVEELKEKYPNKKIFTVDSLCASGGEALLVYKAALLKEEGKSIEEVVEWVEKNKLNVIHWFTVDDLKYLKRGGRISATTAIVGTALNIKPILNVDNDGHLQSVGKARGRKLSLKKIIENIKNGIINPSEEVVFINQGACINDAETIKKALLEDVGVKEVIIGDIGPVIGAHTGPGILAVFCMGQER